MERRAFIRFAFDVYLAAVGRDELLYDCECQTRLMGTGLCPEYRCHFFRGEPTAIVYELNVEETFTDLATDDKLALLFALRRVNRLLDHCEEYLLKFSRRNEHAWHDVCAGSNQTQPRLASIVGKDGKNSLDDLI